VKGSYNAQNTGCGGVTFHGSDLKIAQEHSSWHNSNWSSKTAKSEANYSTRATNSATTASAPGRKQVSAGARGGHCGEQAAIAAANKRFGELGEYNILGGDSLSNNDRGAVYTTTDEAGEQLRASSVT